jgi:uncharacterized coiled-coil protein SlyX
MTLTELEKQVAALEKVVEQLQAKLGDAGQKKAPW